MPANRTRLVSNFPAVKKAAYETVVLARDLALAAGKEVAIRKVQQLNVERGYDLPESDIGSEKLGFQSGHVWVGSPGEFWWRYFEYGTVHIHPFPIIRPAHRIMRKTFLGVMEGELQGFIRRKASVR